MVGVLADAAIAGGAAHRAQLALHRRGQVGGLPLRRAALEVVEHQRGLAVDRVARRAGLAAQRATVDVDAGRGEHEGLEAALHALG